MADEKLAIKILTEKKKGKMVVRKSVIVFLNMLLGLLTIIVCIGVILLLAVLYCLFGI